MVKPGSKTRGRQRIEIRAIECREKRQVTFSKRKDGLLKKASDLSLRCGAHVAVVAFSGGGRPFALCSGSALFAPLHPASAADGRPSLVDDPAGTVEALHRATGEMEEEKARMDQVRGAVLRQQAQALAAGKGKPSWWETDPEALGAAELPEFATALLRLRDNVSRRIDHHALPPPRQPNTTSTQFNY